MDTHCHVDQYPDPQAVIRELDDTPLAAIAVTTTPSAFIRLQYRFPSERRLRLALGVHPLHAATLTEEAWRIFERYVPETRYIGEVGLDHSSQGYSIRDAQEKAFRRVLRAIDGRNKLVTIHSRRAEQAVLGLLNEFETGPVVFHWYSGPLKILDRLLEAGHYCSFNPAMVRSSKGQKVIGRVPKERVLVETDGPYVQIGDRPAKPSDIGLVYRYLAGVWGRTMPGTVEQVFENFLSLFG